MKKLLVVVDMQNDFVTGCLGTPEARAIVPALTEYVKNFDGEVIFTKDTHEKNYLETQEGKYLPVTHCIRGTAGWGIITELKPYVGNDFYCKKTFGSVELANKIKSGNYDEVQFCGVCTGICVISNALMAKAFSIHDKTVVVDVIADPDSRVYPMQIGGGSMADMFLSKTERT